MKGRHQSNDDKLEQTVALLKSQVDELKIENSVLNSSLTSVIYILEEKWKSLAKIKWIKDTGEIAENIENGIWSRIIKVESGIKVCKTKQQSVNCWICSDKRIWYNIQTSKNKFRNQQFTIHCHRQLQRNRFIT